MTTARPGRGSDQFALRLPDGMRERIKLAADLNNRSMNAEIVATLEKEYPPRDEVLAELGAKVDELRQLIADQKMQFKDANDAPLSVEEVIQSVFDSIVSSREGSSHPPSLSFKIVRKSK